MAKSPVSILIVDDDPDVLSAARIVLRQSFDTVNTESNPEKLRSALKTIPVDVLILDMNFRAGKSTGNEGLFWLREALMLRPSLQVIMITAYGEIDLAVEAMKIGAGDFIVKPWDNEKLIEKINRLASKKLASADTQPPGPSLLGRSTQMLELFRLIEKVGPTDTNILILGENGTGKELIAEAIHHASRRSENPFVKIDLGSLAASLFESELFGYRKGAFTDAKENRTGKVLSANRGTLFLDEIGNVSAEGQQKLLTTLQSRTVTPLGEAKSVAVDVRLICATNIDLYDAVSSGDFRQDLLYRINTVELQVPPLRERKGDIELLARHFTQVYGTQYHKPGLSIGGDAIDHLVRYHWPGNVRELQHAIERAVILSDGGTLLLEDFSLKTRPSLVSETPSLNLDDVEKQTIITAIRKHQGNMSQVAKELGLGRTTLYRKLTKYGLDSGTSL